MSVYNTNTLTEEKVKCSNFLNGATDATGASQTFDTAKVQINSGKTKQKLENLKDKYKNVKNPYGFITDLRTAMGLPPLKRVSNYGIITIPKADGTSTVSIRISNHSTNAETYITNNANQEYNLSIVVRKRARKKTFKPHNDVRLDEYIYYGNRLNSVDNPLGQIINSLINFIDSGVYVDTTGVALHNKSPQQPIKENNNNKNANKNIMKINKKQLRNIIKESIKNVLKEYEEDDDMLSSDYEEMYPSQYGRKFSDDNYDYGSSGQYSDYDGFDDMSREYQHDLDCESYQEIMEIMEECWGEIRKIDDYGYAFNAMCEEITESPGKYNLNPKSVIWFGEYLLNQNDYGLSKIRERNEIMYLSSQFKRARGTVKEWVNKLKTKG